MGRKRRNRPPKLPPGRSPGGSEDVHGVTFDLEPDAAEIFEKAFQEATPGPKIVSRPEQAIRDKNRAKKTSSPQSPRAIDLHGMTVAEAQDFLKREIDYDLKTQGQEFTIRIITGKGHHSGPEGPVLAKEIHQWVESTFAPYITSIDISPAATAVDGKLLKGHFDVSLKP